MDRGYVSVLYHLVQFDDPMAVQFLMVVKGRLLVLIYSFLCTSILCNIFCFQFLISSSLLYQIRMLHYLPRHHKNYRLNFEAMHHKFLILPFLCISIRCSIFCFDCLISNSLLYQICMLHYLPCHRKTYLPNF